MNYHILLTGSTGLLGRYLLKDLLLADVAVAVLVRPTRRETSDERVEALMGTWESKLGRNLPRPVVLSGNISEPELGLEQAGVEWVKENCDTMLHNAASLTFQSTDSEGEPWRSNILGTQNVLELCRKTEIRDFHHVSTAYVAGKRHGRVYEAELDVGQNPGNDYETSKIKAEKLVHAADFLAPPTFHRPAIIIGDSQTGFTTTFHGFYAALRLGHTLVNSPEITERGEDEFERTRLTLNGDESKNFVPVDWVSAVMTHVIMSPEHHGKTYHLTPRKPVTTRMIRDVLEDTYSFWATEFSGSGELENPTEIERLFYEHIQVYNSYWRDDPVFDTTNTEAAAPHLPCPDVDQEMLKRLSKVAIDMNFRWKDESVELPIDVAQS